MTLFVISNFISSALFRDVPPLILFRTSKVFNSGSFILISDLLSRPLNKARDQDQDLGHQVSRPRPWPPGLETKTKTLVPGLETKTKTLVIRSRGQDLISRHKYLCMCVYVCIYVCMLAFVYVAYVGRPIKIIIYSFNTQTARTQNDTSSMNG